MFNPPNPYKVLIEERERQIETEEQEIIEEEKELETDEQKDKRKLLARLNREDTRKKWVYEFFKLFANREMTEAEFKEYNEIMDNPLTRKGFNLKNFIEGDKGSIWIEKDVIINQESQ
jgi:hypothetical protein